MNATLKTLLLASAFAALASFTSTAQAQIIRPQIRLYPGPSIPETPRLGIHGHFQYGCGMVVDSVVWGMPASQMGLEAGDEIRAINGRLVQSESDYFRALTYSSGYVDLLVLDVRTGALVNRSGYLGHNHYQTYSRRIVPGLTIHTH
jgi:S1-C subfamily serine protease